MSTEILGYLGYIEAQQTTQQERHIAVHKAKTIKIHSFKEKLLGAILIGLGAGTMFIEKDGTVFLMSLFIGIVAMIGGKLNE